MMKKKFNYFCKLNYYKDKKFIMKVFNKKKYNQADKDDLLFQTENLINEYHDLKFDYKEMLKKCNNDAIGLKSLYETKQIMMDCSGAAISMANCCNDGLSVIEEAISLLNDIKRSDVSIKSFEKKFEKYFENYEDLKKNLKDISIKRKRLLDKVGEIAHLDLLESSSNDNEENGI